MHVLQVMIRQFIVKPLFLKRSFSKFVLTPKVLTIFRLPSHKIGAFLEMDRQRQYE